MMRLLDQPPRPHLVPVVAPWRPAALGQPIPSLNPNSTDIQDIARTVSQNEWVAQKWTKEDAIATFNVANLLWTVREKIAFSATLFQQLVANPRTLGVINATDPAGDFVGGTAALLRVSRQLSQPNIMSSIRNLLHSLEIIVLPSFGVGVRGVRPIFDTRTGLLSDVKTDTSLGKAEVVDFGDLYKTSVVSDMKALEVATQNAKQFAPTISLGALPALATFIVVMAVLVVSALIVGRAVAIPTIGEFAKIFNPITSNPELMRLLEDLRKTDPVAAAALLTRMGQASDVWSKAIDIAMWVAIGIGSIALAFIIGQVA